MILGESLNAFSSIFLTMYSCPLNLIDLGITIVSCVPRSWYTLAPLVVSSKMKDNPSCSHFSLVNVSENLKSSSLHASDVSFFVEW